MLFFTLCLITVITYWVKWYVAHKPFFDLQKKTKHRNWASFKMFECNAESKYLVSTKNKIKEILYSTLRPSIFQISTIDFCEKFLKVFEDCETFWLFGFFKLIVRDPDDMNTIFTSDKGFEKGLYYRLFFKHGLLVENSRAKYRAQRKALNPLFQSLTLRRNIPIINEEMDEFFKRYGDKLNCAQVNAKHITFKFITRTVARTIFGVRKEFKEEEIESIRRDTEM